MPGPWPVPVPGPTQDPDPALPTAASPAREREIIDRLRSLCIFVFVFKNLQLFRWPFATF